MALVLALPGNAGAAEVVELEIEDGIGVATADYILSGIEYAEENGADLIIINMDTPGGLDTSMRSIIQDIHELRARLVNDEIWLEMHVLVKGDIPVTEAHDAVTHFELALDQAMASHRLRISSHIEPVEHHLAHPEGHT